MKLETLPAFDSAMVLADYRDNRHERVSEQFLSVLSHFHKRTYVTLPEREREYIDRFLTCFLHIFTQPDFRISDSHVSLYIRLGRVISNLARLTDAGNTDVALARVRHQPASFVKILTLLSARNTFEFERNDLFDADPKLASMWYVVYASLFYGGLVDETSHENLQRHFQFSHPKLRVFAEVQEVYFGATYAGPDCDREIKGVVNRSMRSLIAKRPPIVNVPKRHKIAVLSACWSTTHSVYRNYFAYVRALKGRFHLTFFQLGTAFEPETSLFDEVHVLDIVNNVPDLSKLQENDFQVAYFPDIGMSPHSIYLANMRIAPIQICSPGHSVSTYGAEIDYFMTGADVEEEDGQRHYSEKLIRLPGMGVIHNKPLYARQGLTKSTDTILINCPWSSQKLNAPFVRTLRTLIAQCSRRLRLRIFLGLSASRQNDCLPLVRDLEAALGRDNIEIFHGLSYQAYMAHMEVGDLTLDSFHFGGCNTISDSLYLSLPTVAWEGTRWYNRIAAQMLRLVGLPDLIATNEQEYVALAHRLITDDAYRQSVRSRVDAADLDTTIYSTGDAVSFPNAVEEIIQKHNG